LLADALASFPAANYDGRRNSKPSLKKELQKVIIRSPGKQFFARPFPKPHFPPGHQTKEIKDFAEMQKDGSCPSRFPLWKIGRTHVQLWGNGTP
jgi:hypothetical protein